MGVIREELVLADAFSSTFGNFISQGDSAIKTLEAIQSELVGLREVSQQSQDFMVGFAEGFSEEFAKAANSIEEAAGKLIRVVDTIEQDPAIVAEYEKRYQIFRSLYPALKPCFAQIAELNR